MKKKGLAILLTLALLLSYAQPLLAQEVQIDIEESSKAVNYVFVENSSIETPDTLNIAVSLNETPAVIKSARLIGYKEENEDTVELEMILSEDNLMLFSKEYQQSDSGTYRMTDLELITEEGIIALDLMEQGVELSYSVNKSTADERDSFEVVEAALLDELDDSMITITPEAIDSEADQEEFVSALSESIMDEIMPKVSGKYVIVLDAGHCDVHDRALYKFPDGTYANKTEGQMNYRITLACKAELEKNPNVKVYLTRPSYACIYPTPGNDSQCLMARAEYAKSVNADALISLHNNASNGSAYGGEVIVANDSSYRADLAQDTWTMGKLIAEELKKLGISLRHGDGLLQRNSSDYKYADGSTADYYAIVRSCRAAGIPGIIVEHAFFDNKSDYTKFLSTDAKLDALGVADAKAILEYLEIKDVTSGAKKEKITEFVKRYYLNILGREADAEGLDYWVRYLANGNKTGGEIAEFFVFGEEMKLQNPTNERFVTILYNTFFGRQPDQSGLNYWLEYLEKGASKRWVAAEFVSSKEFSMICADYGIVQGNLPLIDNQDKNVNVTMYVYRCYSKTLGRVADEEGMNYWTGQINNKQKTAKAVAEDFVFSKEMSMQQLSNEEFIKMLYRVFMGREYDENGLKYWMNEMNKGRSKKSIFDEISGSKEFSMILESFGL